MEIRHKDIKINENNPFENCKLNRQKNAHSLTKIVENYADGFVLAINNEWGAGKTTFVKMWKQHLLNEGFETMYFNAWENDFAMEPLVAMLGELKKLISKNGSQSYKLLLEKAATISKRILPSVGKNIAKKYLGEEASEIISNSVRIATDILEEEVNEYIKKKDNLLEFKKELENYVKQNSNGKPIVFIIDELDRCRPDYAVEVLEKVKHFFNVPGIVFVLSIDKEQLSYAIQGYYGSTKINTDEYLRRFIDIEYQLPNTDAKTFSKYLFDYYSFDDFFKSNFKSNTLALETNFLELSENICKTFNYTPRQQEKLFAFTRLVLRTFSPEEKCLPNLILLLIHFKLFNEKLYKQIKDRKLEVQELVDEFESLFILSKHENIDCTTSKYGKIEAQLIVNYNKYLEEIRADNRTISLFKRSETGNEEFILTSKTSSIVSGSDLRDHIARIENCSQQFNLSFFLEKIELLDNLQTN